MGKNTLRRLSLLLLGCALVAPALSGGLSDLTNQDAARGIKGALTAGASSAIGKLGFSGDQVWDTYLAGGIADVRRYCETDVLNTYLIYLRFQFLRGRLDGVGLAGEFERVRALLRGSDEGHHAEFLNAWEALG